MPMFHAYCQNSADHAKLADKVAKSMEKTLKPSLKSRCEFAGYRGSGHYYYFINPIRVLSCPVLDDGSIIDSRTMPAYSGEYRRDYVYGDDEYNRNIFTKKAESLLLGSQFRGERVDIYKKSFFTQLNHDRHRYKFDGVYVNKTEAVVVNGRKVSVLMLKAGLKTGDIVSIDNRDCFLIKVIGAGSPDYYSIYAIAID
ncbi:hypothetical protein [Campylobacter sp.]|uniref:hypothetical protein n=1 Tax=Campylobacter sp. TaxID=205 RepID=UPI002A8409C7|nr:hypothetical protein [Campylobacter sp.]MDY4445825.1 hypothetical protein [Campylobacter sp.]